MADYPGYPPAYPPADPYAQAYGGYAPPAPGPYGSAPGPYGQNPYALPGDDVRTVFITGFPDDVKERELNNLLRFLPGYEASQMNRNKGQAQGFALFATNALGRAAIDALQHLRFDSDGSTLRCEMARKNMYIKDEPNPLKRPRYSSEPYSGYPPSGPPPGMAPPESRPASYSSLNTKDNPPCNTLFIGNLGDTVSEPELQTFFSVHPGYRQLKLMKGPKNVTCFVEFEDVDTAMAVHTSQQNAILNTSNRGGIRIQYSKNPLGRKRDASGAEILGPPGV